MASTEVALDPQKMEEAAGRIMSLYVGSMMTYMIDIGHRTGLLATAAQGPGTAAELAARAGLHERYVREWLGAVVTGGLFDYDPESRTYALPAEAAIVLTAGPMPMSAFAGLQTHLGKHVGDLARVFREGGGVPYSAFRPEFTDLMDQIGRAWYDCSLVDAYLPQVEGLTATLEAGAAAADFACGTGHGLVVLARRFPASSFVGYDLDEGAIACARAEASGAGLSNLRFEVADIARVDVAGAYDAVFVFDAVHDQVDPAGVLRVIHRALKPGGVFVMKEPRAADRLEDNIGNPFSPIMYSVSTLHCLTVSLAHEGAGIGTAFGEGLARSMLAEAGFEVVAVEGIPGDPMDAVYIARPALGR
ncbi:MAG TPA: class I SAM-dependent methyltransferase [Actinomycetota bacterium]|nr:class I SAM-dependent methyltransferase [Actinomycetota bacterium]